MKTFIPKKEQIERKWYVIDATDKILGRLASRIAIILQGKHKPSYTPHIDMADFVIVINAEKIKVTGKKLLDKKYRSHSDYPGKVKEKNFEELLKTKPEDIIKQAVKNMLPQNKLARQTIKKLKVYKGSEHPHKAAKPEPLNLTK